MNQRLAVLTIGVAMGLSLVMPVHGQGSGPAAPASQAPSGRGGAAPTPVCGPGVTMPNVAKDSRCFELRTYTVQPGSPGDINLLHRRFREHTNRIFQKHGMTIVGFWQPLTKPDTLIYLLAYQDNAARDAAWTAFRTDPEWMKVAAEMNVRVQVDSVFMNATDYSPIK